jgi:hypothetical protein
MVIVAVGIDLAKSVFAVHGVVRLLVQLCEQILCL